jgi:alpha-glucosidase
MLIVWPEAAAAITEARVRRFAGMYLDRPSPDATTLRTRLSPRLDHQETAVTAVGTLESPWRVVLLADNAGKLLESNLLLCLNDPPQGDFTWLKPGKTTFHWWNGEFEQDFGRADLTKVFVDRHKKYIDFCARHGIAYHGLSGDGRAWYPQSSPDYGVPSDDADVTAARPELDLPAILAYAKERNVGIRLWVHWKPLSQQLEPAFTQYEAWGVTGLMVDFLDRDDQEMIDFSERVLESAARHKLNIQFHGSSKYSGEQRTYPNLVNREGVLNLEYLKWSALCDPAHNVNVAYTRALAGPIDYHHGGFRSVSRAAFRPEMLSPVVLGTRCHHLALYLTYENPVPMLADRPEHYENQPGFDFLCQLPTTWDETRCVAGETGEYLVLARRRGADWYLGGITNWTPRTLEVPLSFLGKNTYEAKLLVDGSLDEDHPNEIKERMERVTPSSSLPIQLAPGGGFVGKVSPR